jgi:hypothetical protein
MKKPFFEQENKTDWYVNHNPIEKYLQIERIDNQTVSKFVRINFDENLFRRKIKRIHKQQIEFPSL